MRLLPILLCCFLLACARPFAPESLPQLGADEVRHFRLDRLDAQGNPLQSSLLIVQGDGQGGTRWMQSDAFGAPQARLLASAQGWQRDGFVPPNREAERLFVALFPYIQQPPAQAIIVHGWRVTPVNP